MKKLKKISEVIIVTVILHASCATWHAPSDYIPWENFKHLQQTDEVKDQELLVQSGHTGLVYAAVFSPDSEILATGGGDGIIKLWDTGSGRLIRNFITKDGIYSLSFSEDGELLVSLTGKDLTLWNVKSGRTVMTLGNHTAREASLSPDASMILAIADRKNEKGKIERGLRIWNLPTGIEQRWIPFGKISVYSAAFSPDSSAFAVCGETGITLYDSGTGEVFKNFPGHFKVDSYDRDDFPVIEFSHDGGSVAVMTPEGKTIAYYDVETGEVLHTIPIQAKSFDLSPDGAHIAAAAEDTVRIIDVKTGLADFLPLKARDTRCVAYDPSGRFLAVSDNTVVHVWDLSSRVPLFTTAQPITSAIRKVAISPDGKTVYAVKNHVTSWDMRTGRPVGRTAGSAFWAGLGETGDITTYEEENSMLQFYRDGRKLAAIPENGYFDKVFSADGKYAALKAREIISVWDTVSGERLLTINRDPHTIAFSQDGSHIATADYNYKFLNSYGIIEIWDIKEKRMIKSIKMKHSLPLSLSFSPDAKSLAFYTLGKTDEFYTSLYDVTNGELMYTVDYGSEVYPPVFSPDGKVFASVDFSDLGIRIYETASGKELAALEGHEQKPTCLAFSSDGRLLISGSEDGTVKVWDMKTFACRGSFLAVGEKDYISYTDTGYFDASEEAAKRLSLRVGASAYPMDRFFEGFFRPDLLAASLKGESLSQAALRNLMDGFKAPPVTELKLLSIDGSFVSVTDKTLHSVETKDGFVTVEVSARDTGGGVSGLRLFLNEKIVGEGSRGINVMAASASLKQSFKIQLLEGENTLRAVAYSFDRTESDPAVARIRYTPPRPVLPTMFLLVMGIDSYKNASYNLNYAAADAKSFHSELRLRAARIFEDIKSFELLNEEATRNELIEALSAIREEAKPEDVLVFYYSGHGISLEEEEIKEFYYILHDVVQMTDMTKASQFGFSGTELRTWIKDIKANKQLMIVDACNAGALARGFASRGAAEEQALAQLSRATGSAVFAATTAEQSAVEFEEIGHGVFTWVILEALSGKGAKSDGQITVNSLKSYVDDEIPSATLRYRGTEQYPTTFMFGQDFPIGIK